MATDTYEDGHYYDSSSSSYHGSVHEYFANAHFCVRFVVDVLRRNFQVIRVALYKYSTLCDDRASTTVASFWTRLPTGTFTIMS